MSIAEVAEALYAGVPGDFTAQRTAAEKRAKADGDPALAAAIKALRRPSVAAWALNLLVRWESEQIDQVFNLAEGLRQAAAALDGAELRELTRQRRQLTAALTTRARQLALENGQRLTQPVAEQVESTLTAAMLDEAVAAAVRTGLLVTAVAATGVDEVDLDGVVAYPEAVGSRAPRAAASGKALHAVPDNRAVRREAAAEALAEAQQAVERAAAAARSTRRRIRDAEAHRFELQAEVDEVQRRLADLEARLEDVDADLEELVDQAEVADSAVAEAESARDAAQAAVDEFG